MTFRPVTAKSICFNQQEIYKQRYGRVSDKPY